MPIFRPHYLPFVPGTLPKQLVTVFKPLKKMTNPDNKRKLRSLYPDKFPETIALDFVRLTTNGKHLTFERVTWFKNDAKPRDQRFRIHITPFEPNNDQLRLLMDNKFQMYYALL